MTHVTSVRDIAWASFIGVVISVFPIALSVSGPAADRVVVDGAAMWSTLHQYRQFPTKHRPLGDPGAARNSGGPETCQAPGNQVCVVRTMKSI